jgi:glucose-1-phosphate cytidylyltransferase
MKAVILAGGLGTRFAEETQIRPKPMIEIGGKPILWHIMKGYSAHGINHFVICLGYKGYLVKEFFANYCLHTSDVTFDMEQNKMEVHRRAAESWRVTLVDTGDQTQTGGRVQAIRKFVKHDDAFCLTYGDGVSNVNLTKLIEFHRAHKKLCTLTAVQPPGRFGALELAGQRIARFVEKPHGDGGWINGGFFVVDPSAIDYIEGPSTVWENEPLQRLALEGQLMAYQHQDFWQPMDTLRDKNQLESLWANGKAPWRVWE